MSCTYQEDSHPSCRSRGRGEGGQGGVFSLPSKRFGLLCAIAYYQICTGTKFQAVLGCTLRAYLVARYLRFFQSSLREFSLGNFPRRNFPRDFSLKNVLSGFSRGNFLRDFFQLEEITAENHGMLWEISSSHDNIMKFPSFLFRFRCKGTFFSCEGLRGEHRTLELFLVLSV